VLPYVVDGILGGAIYALAALGLVLTYKTTGVLNFAFGGVATFFGYVFWQLRDQWHLSQWISIPVLVLVVAPLLGLVLESVFRPMASQSAEVQIVVALAILSVFLTVIPLIWNDSDRALPTIFPHGQFRVTSQLVITYDRLFTFGLALVLAGGLYVLLRRTRLGTATRAVVDNRDLAGLIGVNAGTVGQVSWVISTVFAAIAGVVLGTENFLVIYILPFLVFYAFAPAVFGRLTSFPLAFIGAELLGVVQNVLEKYNSTGWVARWEAGIPYLALFLVLVVYGGRLKELRSSLRPLVGGGLGGSPWKGFSTGVTGLVLAVTVLPHVLSASYQHDVAEAMAYAVVALTLVVLTGWTGQISIAQMTFAGVGAFTAAHLAGTDGGRFLPAVLLGALICIPLGLIVGAASLRLSGIFLALASMGFALLMDQVVFNDPSITGGVTGLNLTAPRIGALSFKSPASQFYLCLFVLAAAGFGVYWLRQGPVGRRLQMVRDSPDAATTLGVNLTVTKLSVFVVGAAVASVGGALLAVTQQAVDPAQFQFSTSLTLLLLVVFGGRSLVSGAIVAGALQLVQLLPLAGWIHRYLPLFVAVSVIGIVREPEGTIKLAARQARYCLAVLYRRPRPELAWATTLTRSPGPPPPSGPAAPSVGNGSDPRPASEGRRAPSVLHSARPPEAARRRG
jgi:branched-chain amino acid transport system permease protein